MKFEEEFPSLIKYLHPENHTVHAQQIRENCRDIQKVREALDEAEMVCTTTDEFIIKVKKGLNL